MQRLNTGLIYTNDNCIGCNRCISGCPILGANIAKNINGRNRIVVDPDKCIHCGHCITTCKHSAREYLDDTDTFLSDLEKGEKIVVAVAPSFYLDYAEKAQHILGYLKTCGVSAFYNVSYGADIATWVYVNYLATHKDKTIITQPCAALVNLIEKSYPEYLDNLAPIQSPLLCLAVYIRKYLGFRGKIAFISPCISKKDEICKDEVKNLVQYNVTFQHLLNKLEGIALSKYSVELDIKDEGLGAIYPIAGGMKENLEHFMGYKRSIIKVSNLVSLYPKLPSVHGLLKQSKLPLIFEPLHCEYGCVLGTGVDRNSCDIQTILDRYQKIKDKVSEAGNSDKNPYSRVASLQDRVELLNKKFQKLNIKDFYRAYSEKFEQSIDISEDTFDEIFIAMHKYSSESRHIDCQSCGYTSCRQMVYAIAMGYNMLSNCVRYEKDENLRLYSIDNVTGLPNRYVMNKKLDELIESNSTKKKTIIRMNIKGFTFINSRFGYSGGNKALFEFSKEASTFLEEDDMLFSAGGDSFFVLLTTEHVNNWLYSMNHISLKSIKKEMSMPIEISVRSGVYHMDGTEKDVDTILDRVISAYMITRNSFNTDVAYYNKSVSENIIANAELSRHLLKSIDKNEMFVVYQPKVKLSDFTLTGAEALIRWQHGNNLYPPDKFIPICEQTGFIKRIDFFVLNTVCSKIKKWIEQGLEPVKISVNFSKIHFTQPYVADRICNIIDKWQIPHDLIEIEFTETLYSETQESLKTTIAELHQKQISSSIDDFGSGYSSLSLLQNLDFDILKLDKSLIDTMKPNARARKVVTNIVRMAKDLKMDVVAEGVETDEELSILSTLNCDIIQGYVFDKPLRVEEFEKRLHSKLYSKKHMEEMIDKA